MKYLKRVLNYLLEYKRTVIITVSVAVFLVCAVWLVSFFIPKNDGLDAYRKFDNYNEITADGIKISGNPINFKELQETNPDVCAWINVPGTNIDYPILRSGDGTDEDFYLTHDYMRKENRCGAVYMQKYNNGIFTDVNTVLYGHDLYDGTMFSQLRKFEKKDFFEKNSVINIYTPKHIYTYRIFAVLKSDDRHILTSYQFRDEKSYSDFIEYCTQTAKLVKNVRKNTKPIFDEKLITLSTCTNTEEERLIVVGVRVSDVATK